MSEYQRTSMVAMDTTVNAREFNIGYTRWCVAIIKFLI